MWLTEVPSFISKVDLPDPFYLSDFTVNSAKAFEKYVSNCYAEGLPFCVININSLGGDTWVMCSFISTIESYRKKGLKFCCICSGFAMSAGAVIFLLADHDFRFMGENAILMIHNSSGGVEGKMSSIKGYADFSHAQDEALNQKISRHLKKKADWLDKKINSNKNDDLFMTAKDVLNEGLIKEIGLPEFNVRIAAEFSVNL